MSNPITTDYDKLISKITPEVFSYVKLFADTNKPEYFLVNTIITDLWLDELKIFNETSLELSAEKYENRPVINHVTSDMSAGFKILYSQILTGNIPTFFFVNKQLEYLLILNKMTSKEKIKILVENVVFDYSLWERIISLNINFKDFLPDVCKVIACHHCLSIMKDNGDNIINFFGLKKISDHNVGNKYFRQIQNYERFSDGSLRNNIGEFKIFDDMNKISYHVVGIGPLNNIENAIIRNISIKSDGVLVKGQKPSVTFNNSEFNTMHKNDPSISYRLAEPIILQKWQENHKPFCKKSLSQHYVLFNPEPFNCRPNDIISGNFDDYYSFSIVGDIDIFQNNKMKIIKKEDIDDDSGGC